MPAGYFKKDQESPTPIRIRFYKRELEVVEILCRKYNIDISQALRIIINDWNEMQTRMRAQEIDPIDLIVEQRLQELGLTPQQ